MRRDSLTTYRAKRDFARTAEPSGKAAVAEAPELRFVIQRHDATRLHYDFRLELDGTFKSWAVTKGPSLDPHDKRLAVEVEDHPLDYGDFEGTIPKGQYGGGTVQLWDRGYWIPEGDPHQGLKRGDLKFTLVGERLQGSWVLVRMRHDRNGGKRTNWLLIKHRDEAAREGDGDALLEGPQVDRLGPQPEGDRAGHRQGADALHDGQEEVGRRGVGRQIGKQAEGLAEDGEGQGCVADAELRRAAALQAGRACARWHGLGARGQVRRLPRAAQGRGRRGGAAHAQGPRLDGASSPPSPRPAEALPDCLIDGEICALDHHGAPDFAALQAALSEGDSDDLIFFAFDLLFAEGEDLRALPLGDRKARLRELLASIKAKRQTLRYVDHFETAGDAVLRSACRMHLEGIVSKELDAPYRSGRGGSWVKTKCRAGHEVVIGGWTSEGTPPALAAGRRP